MVGHRQVNVDATLLAALVGPMDDDGAHLPMGLLARADGQMAYGSELLGVLRWRPLEDADRRPSPVGSHEEKLDALSRWRALKVAHGLVVLELEKCLRISGDRVSDAFDLADVDLLLVLQPHLLGRLVKADARAERDDLALERARNQAAMQIQPLRHGRPPPLARSAVVVRGGNEQRDPCNHDRRRGGGA